MTYRNIWFAPQWNLYDMQPQRFRVAIGAVLLLLLSSGALFATVSATATPRDPSRGVAVIFAPWTPAEAALKHTAEAGGRLVRFGAVPFVTIAIPDDDDFSARAFAAGAWLVVDPLLVLGCLSLASAKASPA